MMSQLGKQAIAVYILPKISRRKGNHVMEFAQLRENNMKNIFLEKSYTKCDGEAIRRPISKKAKSKRKY